MTAETRRTERLLTADEVAGRLGVSRVYIYKLVKLGRFPKQLKIGRSARWRESDVSAWIAGLEAAA